jgi:hypothetical protein
LIRVRIGLLESPVVRGIKPPGSISMELVFSHAVRVQTTSLHRDRERERH